MRNTLLTSISKNFPINGSGNKSWFPVVGVVLVVVGLFFSKEIVDIFSGDKASRPAQVATNTVDQVTLTPLQQVRMMLDQGALDQNSQDIVVNDGTIVGQSVDRDADKEFRELLGKRSSRQVMMQARKQSQILFRKIRNDYPDAAYELANFINGVQVLSGGKRKSLDVPDARRYLESLHYAVTRALIKNRADRGALMDWKMVRLYPLVNTARSNAALSGPRMAFKPEITLTEVDLRRRPRGGSSTLEFRGTVTGRDVVKLALLKNGVHVRMINKTRALYDGKAKFFVSNPDASGMFTIRAYDVAGNVFDKSYMFEGRGRGWSTGTKGPNPMVDGYFAVRQ